jgi:mono/diheme cytochrome c family protein
MNASSMFQIALAAVALSACTVGEVPSPDGGGGGGGGGGQSFNAMIAPLVTTCTGCHGGATAPNLSSFAALQPKYKMKPGSTNILATKGDHQAITYLNAAQVATVVAWIDSL